MCHDSCHAGGEATADSPKAEQTRTVANSPAATPLPGLPHSPRPCCQPSEAGSADPADGSSADAPPSSQSEYMLDIDVYTGRPEPKGLGHFAVMTVGKEFPDKYHHFYVDKFKVQKTIVWCPRREHVLKPQIGTILKGQS